MINACIPENKMYRKNKKTQRKKEKWLKKIK
jgi:hypothetical protein